MIDTTALTLFFPGPKSYTGEDVVELHVHGTRLIVQEVFAALTVVGKDKEAQQSVVRKADAGEFTRRAFDNGKIDLTQVEGLADLLNADTQQQKDLALRQYSGHLGKVYEQWRGELLTCLAYVEAIIDFAEDEQDVEEDTILQDIRPRLESVVSHLRAHLSDGRRGEILRSGVPVVILGAPNAGKSTLLNTLARRDVAIVSSIPGTTRDAVEVRLDVAGFPIILTDTAGIRDTDCGIEQQGIQIARDKQQKALLTLALMDSKQFLQARQQKPHLDPFAEFTPPQQPEGKDQHTRMVRVLSRCDLLDAAELEAVQALAREEPEDAVLLSLEPHHPELDPLLATLTARVEGLVSCASEEHNTAVMTRERHREHTEQCLEYLEKFEDALEVDVVLASEMLRQATRCLGRVTGRVDVESLLDVLFHDFCIGK
jgi:tRNA modification GTPase